MKIHLGDIVDSIQTGPFGSQLHRSDYTLTGTPVIMPQDIVNWRLSTDKIVFVDDYTVERLSRHKVSYNDIIYPRRGDISKCAIIGKNEENWLCGTGCLKITINPDKANPKYVFYFLQQNKIGKWIEQHATGATMLNINSSTLYNLPLNLPELAIQNRVIEVLSAYDDMIDNCKRQIVLLEEAAQRLYREWFSEFSPNSMLSDLAEDVGKSEIKSHRTSYECYTPIDCLPKKSLAYITPKDISLAESSLKSYKPKDILFGAMRVYFHKVCIAQENGLTRSTCIVINAINKGYWSYLTMLMFSDETIAWATANSKEGTTMPYISWEKLKYMPIYLPDEEVAKRFNVIVEPYLSKIIVLAKYIRNLVEIKNILLSRLISGQIEINA